MKPVLTLNSTAQNGHRAYVIIADKSPGDRRPRRSLGSPSACTGVSRTNRGAGRHPWMARDSDIEPSGSGGMGQVKSGFRVASLNTVIEVSFHPSNRPR